MQEETFGNRLRWWLQRADFFTDPFALSEADQERKYLPGLFVDRPYLYDILGDVERLQPSFLFARRGEGKTATREMVAYECEKLSLADRVLIIRYFDFSYVLELANNDPPKITAKHHAHAITRACMKALIENVPAPYFERIESPDRNLLAAYAQQFADPISGVQLQKVLNCEPVDIPLHALSALELLSSLISLVHQLGASRAKHYEATFILIDRVDESGLGPDAAVAILQPLISQRPLLEAPGISFKFFLPLEVGEQLKKTLDLRTDRVCIRQIEWDPEALQSMINRRISYYSEGKKTTFEELCNYTIRRKAMKKLIEACDNSPRKLIQMCNRMVHLHISRSREILLDNIDLLDALGEVLQQKEIESIRSSALIHDAQKEAEGVRSRGLYLDDGGHVWVDGTPIEPPLTHLEFLLLRNLYNKSPTIVPTLNLIETIWPGGSSGDEQNLRKLIGRLRTRLEPDLKGSNSRFIKNSKGRGYWLNLDS